MKGISKRTDWYKSILFVPIILFLIFLSFCQEDNGIISNVTVSDQITSDYLLEGALDVYLQNTSTFRYRGKPGIETIAVGQNLTDFENCFVLSITRGDDPLNLVSKAIIKIDGIDVLNADFTFGPSLYTFEICSLNEQSMLEVEVRGEPGTYIDFWIEGRQKYVTDIEGNKYKTVKIGNQIWMAENLKTTKFRNGSSLTNAVTDADWSTAKIGAYCWLDNDINNKDIYGAIYNGSAVAGVVSTSVFDNLCPTGWHIPTYNDWETLIDYVGGENIAGTILTATDWGGTDEFGFKALPGDARLQSGDFAHMVFSYYKPYFWSSTWMGLGFNFWEMSGEIVLKHSNDMQAGMSVRCIKD